jgi:hypothetical protein
MLTLNPAKGLAEDAHLRRRSLHFNNLDSAEHRISDTILVWAGG